MKRICTGSGNLAFNSAWELKASALRSRHPEWAGEEIEK
jgi:hypothetical protein